jgi:hypothetical protein
MKRSIIFFILIGNGAASPAITIDSTKWPLPDSTVLHFTVYGLFHNFHVQNDGMGNNGPDNFDRTDNSYTTFPSVEILRSDSAWSFIDSSQTLVYYKNNSVYPQPLDTTIIRIALDSGSHSIHALDFHHSFGLPPIL